MPSPQGRQKSLEHWSLEHCTGIQDRCLIFGGELGIHIAQIALLSNFVYKIFVLFWKKREGIVDLPIAESRAWKHLKLRLGAFSSGSRLSSLDCFFSLSPPPLRLGVLARESLSLQVSSFSFHPFRLPPSACLLLSEGFVPGGDLCRFGDEEGFRRIDDVDGIDGVALADRIYDILILGAIDCAEDGVLAIEPGGGDMGDEELAAIGARARIGHGEETGAIMLESWSKFVGKFVAGAAHAGAGRVATLDHEIRDNAVEGEAIVEALACQIEEVGDGKGCLAGEEGGMDITLGSVHHDADVGDGSCGIGSASVIGCKGRSEGESCRKGKKCLFHGRIIG